MTNSSKQDARQDVPLPESSTQEDVIRIQGELEGEEQADQAALDAYWAGRNSAMRRSARVAA